MGGSQNLVLTTMVLQGMQSLYEHIIRTSPVGDISDQTLQVWLPGGACETLHRPCEVLSRAM